MKRTIVKQVLIVLAVTTSVGTAQTLKELINIALDNNYKIAILRNEAAVASNNNTVGNTGQLPSVALNSSFANSYNNTLQEFSDGTIREGNLARNVNIDVSAIANWTLFNGFSVYARKDQLGYLEELGQVNSKFYIEQTVSDIAAAYYQLAYESHLLDAYQQSLSISAFRANLESKKKEIGAGNMVDYGNALADYQSDSIQVLAQQQLVSSLVVDINRVVNRDLEMPIATDQIDFLFIPFPSKDTLFEKTSVHNIQLEQQRLMELVEETKLRMEKANRYPKINLFGGYQYSKSFAEVGFIRSNQNLGPTVGVSISMNLYNGGATNRNIENEKLYLESAKLTKQDVKKELDANLLNLYNQYLSHLERIKLAESNIETNERIYKIVEEQLKQGAVNGYDFRLTQLRLLNSQLTLTQLQFSLKTIEINLNRMMGDVLSVYM